MRFGVVAGVLGSVLLLVPQGHAKAPVTQAPAAQAPVAQFPTEAPPPPVQPAPAPHAAVAPLSPTLVVPAPAPVPVPVATSSPRALAVPSLDAKPLPNWSLGAGLSVGGWGLATLEASAPAYSAVIERRLGASTWLALNAMVTYDGRDQALQPSSSSDSPQRSTIEVHSLSTTLLLGARQIVIHGVVDLSLTFAAAAGRHSTWRDGLREGESLAIFETTPTKTYDVGLVGGVAVERELIDGLALRLAFDAASLTFSSTESGMGGDEGVPTPATRRYLRARLSLRPGLYLQFYF